MFELSKSTKEKTFTALAYAALIYGIANCFITGEWYLLLISYGLFLVHGILGNNVAMHRLYSHKGFTTGKIRQYWLIAESILCGAGVGPITYAAIHRAHHAFSDGEQDPHSPHNYNPWYVGLGLHVFRPDSARQMSGIKIPKDLMRDKALRWAEVHYHAIWFWLVIGVWAIFDFNTMLYWLAVPAGIYIIIANGATNVLAHTTYLPFVYRTYDTKDNSVNSPISQFLTMGEGFQNNHHHDQIALNQAFKKTELDPTWYILKWLFLDKETIAKHQKTL